MRGLYRPAALGLASALALFAGTAWGQGATIGPSTADVPQAVAPPAAEEPPKFEGALGLVLSARPEYAGASRRKLAPELAGFVRYGRFTLSGAGGFTTRRRDGVERGLDAELLRRESWRVHLALRYDPGRSEHSSAQLAGLGDAPPTLRARLGLRWQPWRAWALSLDTSIDALARGGGHVVDAGISRTFTLDERQRVVLGVGVGAAGEHYMRHWYGVDERQSAASGLPAYRPGRGWRDADASATWRIEIDPQWAAFSSLRASRLLGPAADSPLSERRTGVSLSAGIARRF